MPSLLELFQQRQQPTLLELWKQQPQPTLLDLYQQQEPMTFFKQFEKEHEKELEGLEEEERKKKLFQLAGQYKTAKEQRVLNQFLRRTAAGLTLGISEKALPTEPPEGLAEQIAAGVGGIAGFFGTPIMAAKGLMGVGKGVTQRLIPGLIKKFGKKAIGRAVGYGIKSPALLATAEAISDVTKPGEAPERFVHGAKIGAIFAAAGLSHVTKFKAINQILSQGAGRALMKATGEYPPEYLTKENLFNIIFTESMNTYFLRHGIHPYNVLTGKLTKFQQQKVYEVTRAVEEANKESGRFDKLEFGKEAFMKPRNVALDLFDTVTDPKDINKKQVQKIKKIMQTGKKYERLEARWNETLGKYELPYGASRIQATKELRIEAETLGETDFARFDKIPVTITQSKPSYRPKLPKPIQWAMEYGEEYISPDLLHWMRVTTKFVYDTKAKTVRPFFKEISTKIKPTEIRLEAELPYEEWKIVEWGESLRGVAEAEAEKYFDVAMKQIKLVKDFPEKPIASGIKLNITDKINDLSLQISGTGLIGERADQTYNSFMRALNLDPKDIRYRDLVHIERHLSEIAKEPIGQRMDKLMETFKRTHDIEEMETKSIKDEQLRKRQESDDTYFEQRQAKTMYKTEHDIRKGKTRGTVLSNMLKIKGRVLWDFRKLAHWFTERTGLPLYQIERKGAAGEAAAKLETLDRTAVLAKFDKMPLEEYLPIINYYDNFFGGYDIEPIYRKLTPRQKEFIKTNDGIMTNIKPDVVWWRFWKWMGETAEGKKQTVYNKKALKDHPEIEQKLEMARNIYMSNKLNKSPKEAKDIVLTFFKDHLELLGVIEDGIYLPKIILGRKPGLSFLSVNEFYNYVDILGRSHTKVRGKIDIPLQGDDLVEATRLQLGDESLSKRIQSYVRQIMNLKYVEESMRTLDDLIDIFPSHFEEARPKGKGYGTLDSMKLWAHRIKGFPVRLDPASMVMKNIQAVFLRTLTATKPRLWFRNLFQGVFGGVTVPHKAIALDPRYIFRKWNEVPKEYRDRFEIEVSQFDPMHEHYFYTGLMERAEKLPVIGLLYKAAKPLSKWYSITDRWNRLMTFKKYFLKSRDLINRHKAGIITEPELNAKLGLEKLEHLIRKDIRVLIDEGKVGEACFRFAKWGSDNSQHIYRRSGKSVFEMTGVGEAWTNLFTWTKSIDQQMSDAIGRMKEGYERGNYNMVTHGAKWIVGVFAAGAVANYILSHATNAHLTRYTDYGLDMLYWEFGGVSLDLVNTGAELLGNMVNAASHGNKEDMVKARDAALRFFDSGLGRQLLPFYAWGLAGVESVTGRSYIQPLYELLNKTGETFVQREMYEAVLHVMFARDPNKQKVCLERIATKAEYWEGKLRAAPDNYWAKFKSAHYRGLYNKLIRYSPIKTIEMIEQEAYEKWTKQFEEFDFYHQEALEQIKRDLEERQYK